MAVEKVCVRHLKYSYNVCKISSLSLSNKNGPRREKTCLRRFANNKGADQPVHPRILISAFIFRIWESIISKLATIDSFHIVSAHAPNNLVPHYLQEITREGATFIRMP